ncbi:MAG TPA: phosphoribosylformylglycinamidine synthase subunit PurS [Nitrososphaeraceae archaeon]|jgi:phosphoribosylformylglycinamidine synthase subunit PurS|nr:phosphoribosylformylglycinamidine synthase subunit PurS [Nitrososphaeraceae archaeon]
MVVSKFNIILTIENKPQINDPEGETIHRDLIVKGGYSNIESVRSAKTLKIIVKSKSEDEAIKVVRKLSEELRLFNPLVSNCIVQSLGKITGP